MKQPAINESEVMSTDESDLNNSVSDENQPSLFWQDEILQVMFWMQGEGFGSQLSIAELRKFLNAPEETLESNLQQLVQNNLVSIVGEGKWELTELGKHEGGRRFADEFEGMLTQGHYECSDPDCDCHSGDGAPCKATHNHQHHDTPHAQ